MEINHLRQQILKALVLPEANKQLNQELEDADAGNAEDPLARAYFGFAKALMARDEGMLINKMKHLKSSSALFESAVESAPESPEIRVLRFSVEKKLPGFLGMSRHLEEDKDVVVEHLEELLEVNFDPDVLQELLGTVARSPIVSGKERERIEEALAKFNAPS